MRVDEAPGTTTVTADTYVLEVRPLVPKAVLAAPDGRIWSHLNLTAGLDTTDGVDESVLGPATVSRVADDAVEVRVPVDSTRWEHKEVRLVCRPTSVELAVTVRGRGTLTDVTLLGGRGLRDGGACGTFRSSIEFASVFTPGPTEPVQAVRPAHSGAVLGVVGDAHAGRLHAVFSPPPLCLALGRHEAPGPTDIPDGDWLAVAVRAGARELRFTELRYEPVDGGFLLRLDYDGHTRVEGSFTTPTLVLAPSTDPVTALAEHRADLVDHGLVPTGPAHPEAPWWHEPIFCGWGAQCARAPLPGEPGSHPYHLADLAPAVVPAGTATAQGMARQDVYDELLAHLAAHAVVPGTVVVDDRWQAEYGSGRPDLAHWSDLRAWIAARHRAGQRVLLWWKAWDPTGVPSEECVTDPWGRAVAVDPGNPAYARRIAAVVRDLVHPDGLDADGLKVDFTQRAPTGHGLRAHPGADGAARTWGIAALHTLLGAMYRAMKSAKADALMITHTPHAAFADVCDMVRLNDVLERDTRARRVPVADQLRLRHAVVRTTLPGHPVDTDQWPMPDREQWRSYVRVQATLGVPALYYAEAIDRSGERLEADDLALVAETWREYRELRGAR